MGPAPASPSLVTREPVALLTAIAVVVVAILAVFEIGLDVDTVETFITEAVVIVTGFLARSRVTPAAAPVVKHNVEVKRVG